MEPTSSNFDETTISADVLSGRDRERFLTSTYMEPLLMLYGGRYPTFPGPDRGRDTWFFRLGEEL